MTFCYRVSVNADGQRDPSASVAARSQSRGAIYARFRAWREHTLPHASYQLAPAFWTSAGLKYGSGFDAVMLPAVKRREPQLTGLAYTARAVYLVVVAGAAAYEHVARLIHCRALMRGDPDYFELRGKRVSMILLACTIESPVADFARRSRVRIVTQCAPPIRATDTKTDTEQSAATAPESPEATKALCP